MVEDKIIGGEFEINIQQQYLTRKEMVKGTLTYSSGRSALYNILALVRAKKGIKTVPLRFSVSDGTEESDGGRVL